MRRTGAEIIIELLEREGITTIAGIPGGANLPMYDALARSGRIRHVLARHEQGAGFMAQGMARASGQPAVCFATSGPGATNVMTAIADAKLDSVPMVCITGQVPSGLLGTDAFQEVDVFGISLTITKHNYLVKSAEELLRVIPEAFRIAASGRPGPVLIDVPKDVQLAEVEFDEWPETSTRDEAPLFTRQDVEAAAEMINKAKRPILYAGGGIVASCASDTLVALAEQAGIPVANTLMGLGTIPCDHRHALGMMGMHAARATNMALEECDLLIAAGVRFDDRATGKAAEFCPNASIIHIDIDPGELGKIRTPHVGIEGDVREVLEAITPLVGADPRAEWMARIDELKDTYGLHMPGADDPMAPYGLIREAARILGDDAIIATDVGQHQMWTAQAYPFRRPRRWLTSGGLGTMGFGLPAAIGAALAEPETTVACFTGDGSLLMNIQELAVAAEENLNVKVILMNNNSLGLVHQQQDLFYGNRLYASDFKARPDYVSIARAFGVQAVDLADADDPKAALDAALHSDGPCLIHVPISAEEKVFPMVPPGAANRESIDSVPLLR